MLSFFRERCYNMGFKNFSCFFNKYYWRINFRKEIRIFSSSCSCHSNYILFLQEWTIRNSFKLLFHFILTNIFINKFIILGNMTLINIFNYEIVDSPSLLKCELLWKNIISINIFYRNIFFRIYILKNVYLSFLNTIMNLFTSLE